MFEKCRPEEAGVRSEGIIRFLDEMRDKRLHLHDLMILRHGKVIAEADFAPWSMGDKHILYSLSKSFTSTAVGFAVQDGLLSVDDRLVDFFPEHLPARPCENMQKITVKHMLTMNTGHSVEPARAGDCWERVFLRSYVEYEPGTHFLYNTAATYMLSAIVQKVTGRKLLDYLREKLMDPLGMSGDIWFEESPTGVATGGFGLNVRVSDIARLGQFYLQRGVWEGRRLLDEAWIADAQTPWSDNSSAGAANPDSAKAGAVLSDWESGYGYQFWMCVPDGVYRGDGAFGQYCVVMPRQDMVIAINSGVEDMQAVLRSIWQNIIPAIGEALTPSDALEERLRDTTTRAYWEDAGEDALPPTLEAAWEGRYVLQANGFPGLTSVEVRQGQLSLAFGGEANAIPLSLDAWQAIDLKYGEAGYNPWGYYTRAAVRAARCGDALALHFCYTDTPFEIIMRLTFPGGGIRVDGHQNVSFQGLQIHLVGYRE